MLSSTPHQIIIGPPDTGKERLLRSLPAFENALFLNLEDHDLTTELIKNPSSLEEILKNLKPEEGLAIHRIDFIHKKHSQVLNNLFHRNDIHIIATSNTTSLNIDNSLYEQIWTSGLPYLKVEETLSLQTVLQYGLLPKVYNLRQDSEKISYLKKYLENYIQDEVIENSKIRNLVAFHLFLDIADEIEGEPLNFTKIAQQLDVDYKTIQNFYQLLIESRVGFYLESSKIQIRKVQKTSPKFYFFDRGLKRSIQNKFSQTLTTISGEYKKYYTAWCIGEVYKLNQIYSLNLHLSYIETKDGTGVDLVIQTPYDKIYFIYFGANNALVKSYKKKLNRIAKSVKNTNCILVTEGFSLKNDEDLFEVLTSVQLLKKLNFL